MMGMMKLTAFFHDGCSSFTSAKYCSSGLEWYNKLQVKQIPQTQV